MSQIVEHIDGEGPLGRFSQILHEHPRPAEMLGQFDRDGDGNPINDVLGAAGGLFGRH